MSRLDDPLSHLPDWEALLHDRKRFLNRLVWSVVLAPPLGKRQVESLAGGKGGPAPAGGSASATKEERGE